MSERIELAKSWFQVANEDILTADQLMQYEDPVLRSICFHCSPSKKPNIRKIKYINHEHLQEQNFPRLA